MYSAFPCNSPCKYSPDQSCKTYTIGIFGHRQTDKQTNKQTNKENQTDRQTEKPEKHKTYKLITGFIRDRDLDSHNTTH